MELKYKQPSLETKKIMSRVALGKTPLEDKDISFKEIAEYKIMDITNHKHCQLVNSGNGAIFIGISSITGHLIIPDQGAWHGFKQIAKFLNIPILTIKTNLGLIDLESLKDTIKDLDPNKRNGLILTSFTAYTAEQNIKEISKIAHENGIILIEDASGAICDIKGQLANGNYSDIIVCSTGSPKILNVGDGGFISTNDKSIFDDNKILLNSFKSNEITASGIATEIAFASKNLDDLIKATTYLKNNLNNVVHSDLRGINLIIKDDNPKDLAWNLKNEFKLDSHGMITKCPNYNRLKIKGVAIEIKNLNYSELNKENLDEMIEIITKYQ